jgi:hypothetical protein
MIYDGPHSVSLEVVCLEHVNSYYVENNSYIMILSLILYFYRIDLKKK